MNLLSTMDKLHHLRTWTIPQAMRKLGILSEGWNPKRDRYEYMLFGMVTSFVHFYSTPTTHPYANVTKVDPLPFPSGPYLKAKSFRQETGHFEVTFPHGYVRVYPSLAALKAEITGLRTSTARFHKIKAELKKGNTRVQPTTAERLIKKSTGLPLSQLGCDPASQIVIKNLKTGAFLIRTPLSFKVSEGYANMVNGVQKSKEPQVPVPFALTHSPAEVYLH